MIEKEKLQKLKEAISTGKKFLVIGHEKPDGDSIGSLLAFFSLLQKAGKNVKMVLKDPVPEIFCFIKDSEKIQRQFEIEEFDTIILLDNGDAKRTGFFDLIVECKKRGIIIINIDHHPRNDLWKLAGLNLIDESASSTCEIIYAIATFLNVEIDSQMATALLLGLFGDTGGFRHSNTSKEALLMSAELLNRGARLKQITENIAGNHSIPMLKLWGIALNRLTFNKKYGVSYSVISKEDIKEAGASEDEVSGLVNLLNSAPESAIALLLYETENDKIRGSLRTESDKIDLSLLAKYLGGGGHKKAAGFTIDGKIENDGGKWQVS